MVGIFRLSFLVSLLVLGLPFASKAQDSQQGEKVQSFDLKQPSKHLEQISFGFGTGGALLRRAAGLCNSITRKQLRLAHEGGASKLATSSSE